MRALLISFARNLLSLSQFRLVFLSVHVQVAIKSPPSPWRATISMHWVSIADLFTRTRKPSAISPSSGPGSVLMVFKSGGADDAAAVSTATAGAGAGAGSVEDAGSGTSVGWDAGVGV